MNMEQNTTKRLLASLGIPQDCIDEEYINEIEAEFGRPLLMSDLLPLYKGGKWIYLN